MVLHAILISLVAIVATIDYNGPIFLIHRPLVTGALTGLVLGNFSQGLIIGATLELMWLGVTGIGGYTPPDTISGAILGTAFAIIANKGVEAGIALAVPISLITQQLDVLAKTITIRFAHSVDEKFDGTNLSIIDRSHYLSLLVITLFKVVPIFFAILIGSSYIEGLFNMIPEFVMKGLNVAGGMLPAVGFAMLINSMMRDKYWIFIILGFFAAAFLKLDTIGVAILAVIVVYFMNMSKGKEKTSANKELENKQEENEEEEYDL